MYRIFPLTQIPSGRRTSSPRQLTSDVALDSRDSGVAGELTFNSSVLNPSFTVLNSVQPGGSTLPRSNHWGNGQLTGTEVQINLTFLSPFNLVDGHLFFVPQVALSNGATFYWLSRRGRSPELNHAVSRRCADLQVWTRDTSRPRLVARGHGHRGGATPPTFNASFSLDAR